MIFVTIRKDYFSPKKYHADVLSINRLKTPLKLSPEWAQLRDMHVNL